MIVVSGCGAAATCGPSAPRWRRGPGVSSSERRRRRGLDDARARAAAATPGKNRRYYNLAQRKGAKKLEIVWVSASRAQQNFDAYLEAMPWPAVPFPLAPRVVQAFAKHAKGYPTLCFMDTGDVGRVLHCDGVKKVMGDPYGMAMPYRSPIQSLKNAIGGVLGVVRALLGVFGIGRKK